MTTPATDTPPAVPTRVEVRRVEVQRVAGRIGAEIGGVDISRPLDPDTVAARLLALERRFSTWKA